MEEFLHLCHFFSFYFDSPINLNWSFDHLNNFLLVIISWRLFINPFIYIFIIFPIMSFLPVNLCLMIFLVCVYVWNSTLIHILGHQMFSLPRTHFFKCWIFLWDYWSVFKRLLFFQFFLAFDLIYLFLNNCMILLFLLRWLAFLIS